MNLLVLTPLVPYPPHDGDKLRLYHFLKYLKGRGHVIDLFCLTRVKGDFGQAEGLRSLCRQIHLEHVTNHDLFFNLLGGLITGQSLNVSAYFSPRFREALRAYGKAEGGQVDAILAHRLRMAPWALRELPGKPVVLELTDCLTAYTRSLKSQQGARFLSRLLAWWDHWFLKSEEVEYPSRAFHAVVVSEPDAKELVDLGVEAEKVSVIPNGVLAGKGGKLTKPGWYLKDAPVVCFAGNMGYLPNEDGALWFLKNVWPRVKQAVPNAVFAAVGGQPRKTLKKWDNGGDVRVTGWVSEIEPFVAHAGVSIAPLRVAGGMQNKVALALSLGTPVVATSTALKWLPPEGKVFVTEADDPEFFAQAVVHALLKPRPAKSLALKGKRFILKNYRWEASGKRLEEVVKKAVLSSKY